MPKQQSARRSFARRVPPLPDFEDGRTLSDALDYTMRTRWLGLRSAHMQRLQVETAIRTLEADSAVEITVGETTIANIQAAISVWRGEGLAPSSINRRLICLSAIGVNVAGCYQNTPRRLKWWLRPSDQLLLTTWLRGHRHRDKLLLADWIDWTVWTGLRIEESLRLTRGDIEFYEAPDGGKAKASITVPGLKTYAAQACLPIGDEARALLISRGMSDPAVLSSALVFPITYRRMLAVWQLARAHLGATDNPLATLKAIRRSAARYLHVSKGMPLDMLRVYLRHESLSTTMSYLRLAGGYNRDEMGKWL